MIKEDKMGEFAMAALPFVMIGICLTIIFINYKKKGRENQNNYLLEGMCMGMCLGVAIATSLHIHLGLGISLGMLIGETIGISIKKEPK